MSTVLWNSTMLVRACALSIGTLVLVGCGDQPTTLESIANPSGPAAYPGSTIVLRGTVDLVAGTMTFRPLPTGTDAISAMIYGDQGRTVRVFNTAVTITNPSSPGKKTFSAPVRVQNLLTFPIGDEQAAGVPSDTMGIDVFIISGPTVTATSAPCPSCTATVLNPDGRKAFSAPDQPYWHWHERLAAAGNPGDATVTSRPWVFETDLPVTNFSFEVSVAAAWPPPHETRWKVEYTGDSIPDVAAAPRWHLVTNGAAGAATNPSPGILRVALPMSGARLFTRYDSIASSTDAYIEVRVQQAGAAAGNPETSFGLDDDVRFVAVGISGSQAGFLNGAFGFLGGISFPVVTATWHTYRIQKTGATQVELWIDDDLITTRPYTDFAASITGFPAGFYFGSPGSGTFPPTTRSSVTSEWDYVLYEIGAPRP